MDKLDTLLIACGSSGNRRQLRMALKGRYNLLEAMNTQQMLMLMEQNQSGISAVVLNITVPEKIDRELLSREENANMLHRVPVVIISSDVSANALNTLFGYGAADVIPLGYDPYAMLRRIETVVELHLHKQHLEVMVAEKADILRKSNEIMVDALSSIIEYRSVESGQHIRRIRHFTKILLEEVERSCPEYQLTDRIIAIISSAAALHDIGKIAIPDAILLKPDRLTQEEWEIMKTHAATGCQILNTLRDMGDPEYLGYAYNICRYHHERWDGGGYPEGISGENIPICAQVVGLADAYDALTTKRVYKDAYSFDRAANMILRGECGIFSPKLLECFKNVTDRFELLARTYVDDLAAGKEACDMPLPAPVEKTESTLDRVWAKYYALVNYINGLLVEVDLDQGLLHLVYNPYPEMAWFQDITTLKELYRVLYDRIITKENRMQMKQFLREDVPKFMDQGMRRMTRRFQFKSKLRQEGEFEITLLRTDPTNAARRTLAALCCRVEDSSAPTESLEGKLHLGSSSLRCRVDESFTLISLNKDIPQLVGYSREELKEQFQNRLIALVVPEDRKKMRRAIRECLKHNTSGETEYRVRHKDGTVIWVRKTFYLRTLPSGEEYLECFMLNITAAKQEFEAMNEKLRQYEIIMAQTENVMFEWDCRSDRIFLSDTWQSVFGGMPITTGFREAIADGSYFHPDDLPLLFEKIDALEKGSAYEMAEVRMATDKGHYLWCRLRATAIRDSAGKLEKVAGIIINIETEKQAQRTLQNEAQRDPLTRLLNKKAGRKQAEEYLKQFTDGANCALLIIDLDNFKQINDQYGHLFGDAVLTRVAREIEKLFRAQDIISRIGGDEFMVLMQGASERSLLENRCQQLLDAIHNAFNGRPDKVPLGCSIGIALAPEHGTTYYDLVSHADHALYWAKDNGKNSYAFYENSSQHTLPKSQGTRPADSNEDQGLATDNLVSYAVQKLYTSQDVERSINDILALIGQKMNVSRVYIFENSDDNRFCSNTYEWCNQGIRPEIHNLQNISYGDIPDYADYFDEEGVFYSPDVSLLKKELYEILAPQGIKSMIQCAIRENGVFRGYMGFDDCVEQRVWTKNEISRLTFFAQALSTFLLQLRRQEKVQRQANELSSILDNQDAWIYIMDPKDFTLKYVNARLKTQLPEICAGLPCYKVMKGRETPCHYCPAAMLGQEKTASCLKYNDCLDCQVLIEATRICWEEEDACLMTSRTLPKECGSYPQIPSV